MHQQPRGLIHTFGSRYSSSVRNFDHMGPKKVDGAGPGSYKLPGSVRVKHRHPASVNRTTFGTSSRAFEN